MRFSIKKYFTTENYRGVWFNSIQNCNVFWKVYQFYIRIFYSSKILAYRADLGIIGGVLVLISLGTCAATIGLSFFYGDAFPVNSEIPTVVPQTDISPKAPESDSTHLEAILKDTPPGKINPNVYLVLFLASMGLFMLGTCLLLLDMPPEMLLQLLIEADRKHPGMPRL